MGQAVLHYRYGPEYLVYNNLSGNTHLLNQQAMRILLALKAGPLTEAELLGLIDQAGEDRYEHLASILSNLLTLSLVQPA